MSKRFLALLSALGGILWPYFWEFVRSLIYERAQHVMEPYIPSYDIVLHYGPAIVLVVLALWLFWRSGSSARSGKKSVMPRSDTRAILSLSGPRLLKDPRYQSKNRWRMKVHNGGSVAARNVQMKLRSGATQPKDPAWSADYPYPVYRAGAIINAPEYINAAGHQINPKDDEYYEIICGWKSEAGQFFTTLNTKGGGHNQIQIGSDERWRLRYEVTAENADPLHFTLQIFVESDEVKVVRIS